MSYASEQGVLNAQWNAANMAFATEEMRQRPSAIWRPALTQDGDHWIALYGEDLAVGVVGCGKTPEEAMADFDRAWRAPAPTLATVVKKATP